VASNLPRKHRKTHRYLNHEEIERLATASGEYSTLVYLASYTGLRWGELTALRVRDVDALRRRLAVSLLFGDGIDYLGRPRSSGASRSRFMTALDTARLERMTVHDLRHTAASLAISSGANVKAVQRMLGHASAAMTLDVYADLFDDDLDTVSVSLNDARNAAIVRGSTAVVRP
jgi:integrase